MEKPNKKQVLLFYCIESEQLAQKVAAHSPLITLQSINWRSFDDGFPNLFINNAQDIRGQHVAFLASFSSPAVIFEQLSVIFALPRLFVASFTLVLPFFPTGSFERMEEEGDVATAFTMARILSNIPISRGGPTSVVIYDIHALQVRKLEFLITFLVLTIAACLLAELGYAKPQASKVLHGLSVLQLKGNVATGLAISLLDAMVMPWFILSGHHGSGEKEFKVEVKAFIRVRHKNFVRLLGYNVEGAYRMLVYDYVYNGN